MRKSVLSMANIEEEIQPTSDSLLEFKGIEQSELTVIKDEALRNNNIRDYEAAVHEIMRQGPGAAILKEFIDAMTERKDFKRLNVFYNQFSSIIEKLIETDSSLKLQVKLSRLMACVIKNKDPRAYVEYKKLRSILLYKPDANYEENYYSEVCCKITLADDLIANTFSKTLVGNRQYEKIDKTKISNLPYVDVEVITASCRGESHFLMLTSDQHVLAYGDNSRGQLLPFSTVSSIDKTIYLPSIDCSFEVMKAKYVFARENHSAVLGLDGRLMVFGDGWTDRYIIIEECAEFEWVLILRDSILLISDQHSDITTIHNSLLKDYLLSETASRSNETELCYLTSLDSLYRHEIAEKVKKNISEKIAKVVNGVNHALFLTENGKLFGYGQNDKNQLCYTKTSRFEEVTELNNTKGETIASVFAFQDFTVTVDESGNCNIVGKISRSSKLMRAAGIPRAFVHI